MDPRFQVFDVLLSANGTLEAEELCRRANVSMQVVFAAVDQLPMSWLNRVQEPGNTRYGLTEQGRISLAARLRASAPSDPPVAPPGVPAPIRQEAERLMSHSLGAPMMQTVPDLQNLPVDPAEIAISAGLEAHARKRPQ